MQFLKKLLSPITATLGYIQNHFKAMIFLLILFLIFSPNPENNFTQNNLTEIKLFGPIMDVSEVLAQIEDATTNEYIKGVLLNVSSGGGAVSPSVEISYAIKRLKEHKPVVAYASGTMASGSYYASIWADEIIANPGSMIGSIGVIMQSADLSKLMSKIGIKTQGVHAGKYKEIGTPSRAWKDYEVKELNKVLNGTYDMFTKDVADARGLDIKERNKYADAHIFTAAQAKEVGLVDKLGVIFDAKKRVEELAHINTPVWNKEDKFDKLMKKLTASSAVALYTYFPSLVLK